ncbi:MAG: polysaccharide biosynthesis/export family protein [Deltaproteobacteria bacterium]|nr:polysaccharide biosynthesis/export family protein [Deltaproteobacteria bacterium]
MKTFKGKLLFALLVGLTAVAVPAGAADTAMPVTGQDYLIGPGDVLEISVWKEEALTKRLTVLPDGKISFPLIGEAMASGWTVSALKNEIETRLARFVPDPVLSVSVYQLNSLMIYVIGKVNNPGRFVLNTNVDVLQALAMSGGLNSFAKRTQIMVFRKQNGQTKTFDFNYDDVTDGKNLEQNIQLVRGDVIVVP